MNKKTTVLMTLLICGSLTTLAQFGKLKGMLKKKDATTENTQKVTEEVATTNDDDIESASTENIISKKEAWQAKFDREINWFNLTSLGTVVVSTDDALYGIEPISGKINWKNESFKKGILA